MADSVVAGWLIEIGLQDVIPIFREEGIDSEALAALDDSQLKELGVKRMGDRTKLRAKAMGIALPAPFASSPPRAGQPDNGMRGQGGGGGQNVPEHLKVLNRISAASPPAKLRVRSTVDDLAEKISATNFVLAGGPLEKYTNGGKGKPHKKFFRMLPDKKLNYDGKSVGPVLSVLNGCGPIVQEHHNVSAETAARSFRVVCEGGVSLLLIAPSAEEKTKWMEGIEIMLIGGYKRKKEQLADPLSASATEKTNAAHAAKPLPPTPAPQQPLPAQQQLSTAPKLETHQGLGLPSVVTRGNGGSGISGVGGGAEEPKPPPRRSFPEKPEKAANSAGEIANTAGRRPESARPQTSLNSDSSSVAGLARDATTKQSLAHAPATAATASTAVPPLAPPAAAPLRADGEVRRVMKVQALTEQSQVPAAIPMQAPRGGAAPAAPVPTAAPADQRISAEETKKVSVLQMANNFAQKAEEVSPQMPPPERPTIKWLTTDKVFKVNGNTITKASAWSASGSEASGSEEYGVAIADVSLSSGVHEWEVQVGGKGLHWCGIGVAIPEIHTGTSLRRPEARGRAWFYHSKGFLCNGNEFVGDWEATPTFVSGDRIGVRLDLTRGVMVFTCNGKQVPGALQGIGGKVVPVIYMDNAGGHPASCTFTSLPARAK